MFSSRAFMLVLTVCFVISHAAVIPPATEGFTALGNSSPKQEPPNPEAEADDDENVGELGKTDGDGNKDEADQQNGVTSEALESSSTEEEEEEEQENEEEPEEEEEKEEEEEHEDEEEEEEEEE